MSDFKEKIASLIHIKRTSDFCKIQDVFADNAKEILKAVIENLDKIESIIKSDFRYYFNEPKESVLKLINPTCHQPVLTNYEFKVGLIDVKNNSSVTTMSLSIKYDFGKERLYGIVSCNFKHRLTGHERFNTSGPKEGKEPDCVLIDILDKVNDKHDKVIMTEFFTDQHHISLSIDFV